MPNNLEVWREFKGGTQHVGTIASSNSGVCFSYDESYSGEPISLSMPVCEEAYSPDQTATFFSAIAPEGATRQALARIFRAEQDEFVPFLDGLRDESIGALIFSSGDDCPCSAPHYEKIDSNYFDRLSARPLETTIETMGKTRLSLTGAMAKVGLYEDPTSHDWFFPRGGASSTHIIKAADSERFPLETLNEALCLRTAAKLDLPAAESKLISIDKAEPLLAVRRFDRIFDNSPRGVDGHPAPLRLHQEDFVQATSIGLKYEPTDGAYLSLLLSTTSKGCANSFGEAYLAFQYTVFNYLIGNCDNHLKNYALLSSPDWKIRELAPLYDITSTVIYPNIYLEMGVSFGGDRRIDHVTRQQVLEAAIKSGIPTGLAKSAIDETVTEIIPALESAASEIANEGFNAVDNLHETVRKGIIERRTILLEA